MPPLDEERQRYTLYQDYLIAIHEWPRTRSPRKAEATCWIDRQGTPDKLSCVADLPERATPLEIERTFDGLEAEMQRLIHRSGCPPADPSALAEVLTRHMYGDA